MKRKKLAEKNGYIKDTVIGVSLPATRNKNLHQWCLDGDCISRQFCIVRKSLDRLKLTSSNVTTQCKVNSNNEIAPLDGKRGKRIKLENAYFVPDLKTCQLPKSSAKIIKYFSLKGRANLWKVRRFYIFDI